MQLKVNILALASLLAVTAVGASPTYACDDAYNGYTPDRRGPGQTYSCSDVDWVRG